MSRLCTPAGIGGARICRGDDAPLRLAFSGDVDEAEAEAEAAAAHGNNFPQSFPAPLASCFGIISEAREDGICPIHWLGAGGR